MSRHATTTHVFVHILNSLQHILGPYIALGNCLQYRQALAAGQPISPTALETALRQAEHETSRLTHVIRSGDLGDYRDVPPNTLILMPKYHIPTETIAHHLTTDSKKTVATSNSPSAATQNNTNSSRPNPSATHTSATNTRSARGNRPHQDNAALEAAKTKGLIEFTGTGKRPAAAGILVKHRQTQQLTSICANFVTKGYACRFGRDCNLFHVHNKNDLPADKRTAFSQFVENHPQLKWATPAGESTPPL